MPYISVRQAKKRIKGKSVSKRNRRAMFAKMDKEGRLWAKTCRTGKRLKSNGIQGKPARCVGVRKRKAK